MLKFIKDAIPTSQLPDSDLPDLLDILIKNMAGYRPARSLDKIHASDITKEGFCPRQVALLEKTGKKQKDQYIDAALRATFDQGDDMSDRLRSQWLGHYAFGNWRCRVCHSIKKCCTKPDNILCCNDHHGKYAKCDWQYKEMEFISEEYQVSGSYDVLVKHGSKLMIVELKIIAPDAFDKLVAPLAEHRQRTCLYMALAEGSKSVWAPMVMTDRAKVLYFSRAHGKKDPVHNKILPFKQYTVDRDDECLKIPLQRAAQVKLFRSQGLMPHGICPTMSCPIAKKCPVVVECFSGKYKGAHL